jgi:hypothetical protein
MDGKYALDDLGLRKTTTPCASPSLGERKTFLISNTRAATPSFFLFFESRSEKTSLS